MIAPVPAAGSAFGVGFVMAAASCKGQSPAVDLPQTATRQIPDSNQFIEGGLQPDEWLPFSGSNRAATVAQNAKPGAATGVAVVELWHKGFANLLPKRIILLEHSPNSVVVGVAEHPLPLARMSFERLCAMKMRSPEV